MSLQDELTTEFLSWVLGTKVDSFKVDEWNSITHHTDGIPFLNNLDTLTRLIKEKCREVGYSWFIVTDNNGEEWNVQVDLTNSETQPREWCSGDTELEAVIKAGKYVMENVK